jgi:hypothetical protein
LHERLELITYRRKGQRVKAHWPANA